jgi:hypothetical protein
MPEIKRKVGDKVYIARIRRTEATYAPGVIVSFTPTGRINIQDKDCVVKQYDKNGERTSGTSWDAVTFRIDNIPFDVRRDWVIQRNQCRAALDAMTKLRDDGVRLRSFHQVDRDELRKEFARISEVFDAAKAAVEAIGEPVSLKGGSE